MASIAECNRLIDIYNDMRDKVRAIVTYLETYNDISDKLLVKINQNYSVDNNDANIYNRIKNNSVDVNKTSNYLKNTIIPAIDAAIVEQNEIIYEIEQEEARRAEEAKQRALAEAEAAKKAAEEAAKNEEAEVDKNNGGGVPVAKGNSNGRSTMTAM